ncbi:MAG: sugar phosphate nucleotidyltransferase [Syntrophorhabdales bacterium]
MKAGIISAGMGERLAPGFSMPKPMVPICGEPMIGRLIRVVKEAGISSLCCIINEQSPMTEKYLTTQEWPLDFELVKKTTDNSLESLFTLAPLLKGGPFLLLTVDTVFRPLTLKRFLAGTAALPYAQGVLAVTRFSDDEKPLRVEADRDHRVRRIGHEDEGPGTVTAGFYRFDPSVFDFVEAAWARRLTALRQFLCFLPEVGFRLYAISVAKTIDVDQPEDVAAAEDYLRDRGAVKTPWSE